MKILIVGGAVRDLMIGRPPKDIDYLVQGVTETEFLNQFPDAKKVGKDFPVYLVDGEEHAFARLERKSGTGHTGFKTVFSPDVTIEQDLERRDITINAMAMCPEDGSIVTIPGAINDILNKVIRHTGPAFKEDPLRVFRVARFASELDDFIVAPETLEEMYSMRNELIFLPAERVVCEMRKALESKSPHRFFQVLMECECLGHWFPELEALIGVPAGPDSGKHANEVDCFDHTMKVLLATANNPCLRYASLCHDLGKALSPEPPRHVGHDKVGIQLVKDMSNRLKVPKIWKQSAVLFCEEHIRMHNILIMKPGKAVDLVMKAEKGMTFGLRGFLNCSMGDGMQPFEAKLILLGAKPVFDARLPKKDIGRGAICKEIMHQRRCKLWKQRKLK